ncbi:BEN domain-containing protein 5-like isoform X2 [Ornithodoros turicata]|uniref:BEN domain-containing protein 5-like isoform X2 n=1 Tax=Ornithodoros turicata TaxID=34597 RepID=UPI0031395DAB
MAGASLSECAHVLRPVVCAILFFVHHLQGAMYAYVRYVEDDVKGIMPVSLIKSFNPQSCDVFDRNIKKAFWQSQSGAVKGFYDAKVLLLGESKEALITNMVSRRMAIPEIFEPTDTDTSDGAASVVKTNGLENGQGKKMETRKKQAPKPETRTFSRKEVHGSMASNHMVLPETVEPAVAATDDEAASVVRSGGPKNGGDKKMEAGKGQTDKQGRQSRKEVHDSETVPRKRFLLDREMRQKLEEENQSLKKELTAERQLCRKLQEPLLEKHALQVEEATTAPRSITPPGSLVLLPSREGSKMSNVEKPPQSACSGGSVSVTIVSTDSNNLPDPYPVPLDGDPSSSPVPNSLANSRPRSPSVHGSLTPCDAPTSPTCEPMAACPSNASSGSSRLQQLPIEPIV